MFEIHLHVQIVKYLLKIWRKLRLELILTKSQLQFSQILFLANAHIGQVRTEKAVSLFLETEAY